MNTYKSKKSIIIVLAFSFALSSAQMTYPIFNWLDSLRDKLSEPIMGKVTKEQNKIDPHSPLSNPQTVTQNKTPQEKSTKKRKPEVSTPLVLSIAEMLTQAYCTDGIKTPINRIGANASIKTGYQWFGRKISSAQAFPQLAKSILVSSVMFSIHNLAAYFLYPNWLKTRWWTKGFADGLCSSMVMGLANTVFGADLEND